MPLFLCFLKKKVKKNHFLCCTLETLYYICIEHYLKRKKKAMKTNKINEYTTIFNKEQFKRIVEANTEKLYIERDFNNWVGSFNVKCKDGCYHTACFKICMSAEGGMYVRLDYIWKGGIGKRMRYDGARAEIRRMIKKANK